jgi:hypothetical protein
VDDKGAGFGGQAEVLVFGDPFFADAVDDAFAAFGGPAFEFVFGAEIDAFADLIVERDESRPGETFELKIGDDGGREGFGDLEEVLVFGDEAVGVFGFLIAVHAEGEGHKSAAVAEEVEPAFPGGFEAGVAFAGEKDTAHDVFADFADLDADAAVGGEGDEAGELFIYGGAPCFKDELAGVAVVALYGKEVNDEPEGVGSVEGFVSVGVIGEHGTDAPGDVAGAGEIEAVDADRADEFVAEVDHVVIVLVIEHVGGTDREPDPGGEDGGEEFVGVLASETALGGLEFVGLDFVELTLGPAEGVAIAALGGIKGWGAVAGDGEIRVGRVAAPGAEAIDEEVVDGGGGVVAGDAVVETVNELNELGAAVACGGGDGFAAVATVAEGERAGLLNGFKFVVDTADGTLASLSDEGDDGSLRAGLGDHDEIVHPPLDVFQFGGALDLGEEVAGEGEHREESS